MADPDPAVDPAADPGPPPDNGVVASAEPGVVTTPDGWTLTVVAKDETQLPIAPLTTAVSSREYLVGGTFTGTVTGGGKTTLAGGASRPATRSAAASNSARSASSGRPVSAPPAPRYGGIVPTGVSFPLSGTIEIHVKPGSVTQVPVDKKSFKAAPVRVTLKDTHIKVDGCVGQSFLRSYATLTSSTTDTDDIVAYYGVTKSV